MTLVQGDAARVVDHAAPIQPIPAAEELAATYVRTLPRLAPARPRSFDAGLFHPRKAQVSDQQAGRDYVWRDQCGNSNEGHQLAGGYELADDPRSFIALGNTMVGGKRVEGLIARAYPDGNVLIAEWPVEVAAGDELRLRFAATDMAARESRNGSKLTVCRHRPRRKPPRTPLSGRGARR